MTYLTKRTLQQRISPAHLFIWTLICLALIALYASSASAQAPWTTVDGSGNINSTNSANAGIGTTSPGAKLDVLGGTYNTGIRITSNSSSGSGLTIKSTDAGGR